MADVLIRKCLREDQLFSEVRVAIIGNVDSGADEGCVRACVSCVTPLTAITIIIIIIAGKSTLLGVLWRGQLDNGRGLARLNVFRHKHEVRQPPPMR